MKLAQQLLLHIGCHVVPAQCFLPKADQAFDDQGVLKDARAQKQVQALAAELLRTAAKLAE